MGNISVLDCTLRDGGYCNEWDFGLDNIKSIIQKLVEAQINIVECGFLTQKVNYEENISKFTSMEELSNVIPKDRNEQMFVCMLNYGEYDVETLPKYQDGFVDGIRVAFHKKDVDNALKVCEKIKGKGYEVFVQPMVSLGYEDEEFIRLIKKCNLISPYAFYIVDSFGVMKRKDLRRLFYMVEHNLADRIKVGYHSHNNMQLAYSNAQSLVDIRTKKDIIIDSSIYGMGRGAGNLNTELFIQYLNDNCDTDYKIEPLLSVIDEILIPFYEKNYWGYSLPNYLSATHNIHPNYANYLDEKKTLTIEAMNEIFSMIPVDKKSNYDKAYIETLYSGYMTKNGVIEENIEDFKQTLRDKTVLLIAPGKSVIDQKEKVLNFVQSHNVVTIGINYDYPELETDYIFVSNTRRFKKMPKENSKRYITTSNVLGNENCIKIAYQDLINEVEVVQDNAGMMLIKFLMNIGIERVYVAGLDGYSVDMFENFATENMIFGAKKEHVAAMNFGMESVLNKYKEKIEIQNITDLKYIRF